jgi:hypothetical protein
MMRGTQVTSAQKLLVKNVFNTDFLMDEVDGECGPATARGFTRAKYWAGYPEKYIVPTFGDKLNNILRGKDELPPEYKRRRAQRLKAAEAKPISARALSKGYEYLGVKEKPAGSNRVVFTDEWDMIGPWCDMFVSCCYAWVGSKAGFRIGNNWAYVPYHLHAAYNADFNGMALVRPEYVVPGDIITFDWDKDGVADHIGFVVRKSGSTFHTLEGNTSAGNNSNGGQVQERERTLKDCAKIYGKYGFIHVGR